MSCFFEMLGSCKMVFLWTTESRWTHRVDLERMTRHPKPISHLLWHSKKKCFLGWFPLFLLLYLVVVSNAGVFCHDFMMFHRLFFYTRCFVVFGAPRFFLRGANPLHLFGSLKVKVCTLVFGALGIEQRGFQWIDLVLLKVIFYFLALLKGLLGIIFYFFWAS